MSRTERRYARILVALDLSPNSRLAVEHAADLAERIGAEVVLAHVTPPQDQRLLYEDVFEVEPTMEARIHDHVLHELEQIRRTLPDGVPSRCVHVEGDPRSGLIELCRRERVDLIVMTTHGRTGASHVILGSVAEELCRSAPCSVLVVRDRAE